MVDTCIETEMTTYGGVVRDASGNTVTGALVTVADLFLSTTTDSKGRWQLDVPPGRWVLEARAGDTGATTTLTPVVPKDQEGGRQEITLDLRLGTVP